MPVYKAIFSFDCNGRGWSEVWFQSLTGDLSLKEFYTVGATPLALKRVAMLGVNTTMTAVEVSKDNVLGDGYLSYVNYPGPLGPCDTPDATVYTRFWGPGYTRGRTVFVRGFPDDVDINGGKFDPVNLPFKAAFDSWKDLILSVATPWGWMTRSAASTTIITNYVQDPLTGLVTITVADNVFPVPVAGGVNYVSCNILFKGLQSKLNGTRRYQVVDAKNIHTVVPEAVFPYVKQGTLTVYQYAFTGAIDGKAQRISRRGAGRPTHLIAGRLRVRPRG